MTSVYCIKKTSLSLLLGIVLQYGQAQFTLQEPKHSRAPTATKTRLKDPVVIAENGPAIVTGQCDGFSNSRAYVNGGATGTGDGTSWANAFVSLATTLNVVANCPVIKEIWVAKGVYKPDGPGGSRFATFNVPAGVRLFGGFAGTETDYSQRDFHSIHTNNLTKLSGDLNGDDGPNFSNNSDNSISVVKFVSGLNDTFIDGFTVSDGNAAASGGGVNITAGSPGIYNCIISGNFAAVRGGGMLIYGGSPYIRNTIFIGNKSQSGGAIHNMGIPGGIMRVLINNCLFINNVSTGKGAILYSQAPATNSSVFVTAISNSFSGNTAATGETFYNAAEVSGSTAKVTLSNNIFWGNGGANTMASSAASGATATIISDYSLYEPMVTGYTGANNLTALENPFASATDLHVICNGPLNGINLGNGSNIGTISGSPSLDLDNNSRPAVFGNLVDIGAYEKPVSMTWLGLSTNWSSTSNWSGHVLPDACTDIIVDAGVPNGPFVTGVSNIVKSLRVNSGAIVTVATGATLTVTK
ncbi:MAG: hypothetical protein V4722_09430 [Bacteroidota bacterium]